MYKKATGLIGGEIAMRIKNRKQLLKERLAEYEVFGRTSEDADYDNQIIAEIKELEASQSATPEEGKE